MNAVQKRAMEAAERRRSYLESEIRVSPLLVLADCQDIADGYLAEHPVDDDYGITGDWLCENGFYRPMQVASENRYASAKCVPSDSSAILPVVSVAFPRTNNPRIVPIWTIFVYGYATDYNQCPTRGQFRALLRGLGVGVNVEARP